jgi:hypothetical protein
LRNSWKRFFEDFTLVDRMDKPAFSELPCILCDPKKMSVDTVFYCTYLFVVAGYEDAAAAAALLATFSISTTFAKEISGVGPPPIT